MVHSVLYINMSICQVVHNPVSNRVVAVEMLKLYDMVEVTGPGANS